MANIERIKNLEKVIHEWREIDSEVEKNYREKIKNLEKTIIKKDIIQRHEKCNEPSCFGIRCDHEDHRISMPAKEEEFRDLYMCNSNLCTYFECKCNVDENQWQRVSKKEKSFNDIFIKSKKENPKCRGFIEPLYRVERHLCKNPYYLGGSHGSISKNENDWSKGLINTTDEFLYQDVHVDIGTVCMDCKKSNCGDGYEGNNKR